MGRRNYSSDDAKKKLAQEAEKRKRLALELEAELRREQRRSSRTQFKIRRSE